ncbi:MAG: thioredoxin domain-containing protein, partial [Myxococcales bacterium]|nr:thioredoxin domain-containing protein [Myxococcales bacterium]
MTGSYDDARQVSRRGILLLAVVLLAILGVADGVYLSLVHIDYELGKPSELAKVCSQFAAQGCSVTTGRFGSLLGIPVSLLGLGGAAATAVVGLVAWLRRARIHDPWRSTLLALAGLSVLASAVMATLSALEGSYCPFCVAWYGINVALGVAAWLARGARQEVSLVRVFRDGLGLPGLVAGVALVVSVSLSHWYYADRRAELRAELEMVLEMLVAQTLQEPAISVDTRGMPAMGPEDATLTIVEVADFQCPFCRRLWQSVHDYTEHTTASVRVAFVHYPLDAKCNGGVEGVHPLACQAAEAAECARAQDPAKFWDYGDLLFAHQPALERDDLLRYAAELSLDQEAFTRCLDQREGLPEVRRSLARAILMGVDATPTFFVNGHKFRGALPKPWMPLVLDKMARAAKEGAGAPAPA